MQKTNEIPANNKQRIKRQTSRLNPSLKMCIFRHCKKTNSKQEPPPPTQGTVTRAVRLTEARNAIYSFATEIHAQAITTNKLLSALRDPQAASRFIVFQSLLVTFTTQALGN